MFGRPEISASEKHRIRCLALVLIFVLGLLLFGCERPATRKRATDGNTAGSTKTRSNNSNQKPENEGRLKATFRGAEIAWDDENGHPIWRAQFKQATASQTGEGAVVEITGVEASLYREGKLASKLVAPRVVADSRTREVRATGGVKVVSALHKSSASADRLVWKPRQDKLIASGGVRMQRDNLTISASTLEGDTALGKVRLTNAELNLK